MKHGLSEWKEEEEKGNDLKKPFSRWKLKGPSHFLAPVKVEYVELLCNKLTVEMIGIV